MYVSKIAFRIKNDQAKTFEDTVRDVTKMALDMPGCRTFMMLVNPYDSSQYVLYEEWDTAEQADAFKKSKIRNEAVAKVASAMIAAPELTEFEVQRKAS
jgi:quinol monooxygenase YgiN